MPGERCRSFRHDEEVGMRDAVAKAKKSQREPLSKDCREQGRLDDEKIEYVMDAVHSRRTAIMTKKTSITAQFWQISLLALAKF